MRKTETLNLRVSPEFKRRLFEEARQEKRSVTNYIEAALSEFWTLKASRNTHKTRTKKGHAKHA
jgi:predicted transcriptional regulator